MNFFPYFRIHLPNRGKIQYVRSACNCVGCLRVYNKSAQVRPYFSYGRK